VFKSRYGAGRRKFDEGHTIDPFIFRVELADLVGKRGEVAKRNRELYLLTK